MPRLLRVATFRFAALYVAVFSVSAMALGLTVFFETRSALQEQMAARVEAETAFLKGEFRTGGRDHLLAVITTRGRGATALDYLVEDRAGTRLVGEMPAQARLQPGWVIIDVPQASEDGGRPERVRALVSDLDGGLLLAVGDDLGQFTEVEEAIGSAFIWTVGLAALLGIGGGVLLSRAFLNRVDAIARTAEAIIGGDLARRVPVRGTGDDLDRLAGTLNRMLDRIGALMDSLRQVSSDVAHDLRTPLTRLYQRLEDAQAHARSMPEYKLAINAALAEAERLLETFSALLRIAQVEGASPRAGLRDVDLSAVAEAVADAYRPDAEDAGHRMGANIAPGVMVRGDQELLTQVLANLVENALRHTPPGTCITIGLTGAAGTGAQLMVQDDGPGVSASDLPRLVDRFYRGERSRTTPGNGLGLSLVSAVADLHGASLSLSPAQPGLLVMLIFPSVGRRFGFLGPEHDQAPSTKPDQPQSVSTTVAG